MYSNTISVNTYNGSTLIGTKTCPYNAHVVNSNPIIPTGSPANEYYYLNARDTLTRTIFSNNQFIQNISQVDRIVNKPSAMPPAQNGASLVKVICAFAGLTGEILAEDIPTSEGSFSITLGKPTTYGTQTAQLTAIDSRGNSTTVVVDAYTGQLVGTGLNYIAQYSAPSIVASCERQSNFENDTTISISGAMTSLKRYNENTECNAVNATNGIQYRYKESTSSTWGAWKNVRSTTSADGSVSTTACVISLDNQKEWDFELKITDKISSTTIARHVGQGQPQFFIGADGRTSFGGVPQIAIPKGKLGQLEVNGNAYANGNRLAEIPITNDMLGSKCVKSNNIDWTTITKNAKAWHSMSGDQTASSSWATITNIGTVKYTPTTSRIAICIAVDYFATNVKSNILSIGYQINSNAIQEIGANDWYPGNCGKKVLGIGFATVTPGVEISITPKVRGASNFIMKIYQERAMYVWDL